MKSTGIKVWMAFLVFKEVMTQDYVGGKMLPLFIEPNDDYLAMQITCVDSDDAGKRLYGGYF
jgi:hypothetical protein